MTRKKWLRIKQKKLEYRRGKNKGKRRARISKIRGLGAEHLAARALGDCVRDGIFEAFVHACHNDDLDASHIDLTAINNTERKLFILQVKTKARAQPATGRESSADRHRRKYPHIPLIEIRVDGKSRSRARLIKREILQIYRESPSAERVLDRVTLAIIAAHFRAKGCYGPFFWEADSDGSK